MHRATSPRRDSSWRIWNYYEEMANGHGGRREGSGHKPGTPNTRETAKIVKDLVERGEAPLQYFPFES